MIKSGLDRSHRLDSVRPQDDLYRHVNGAWLESAEIPADRALNSTFDDLRDRAQDDLRALIDGIPGGESGEESKVRDLYTSFMNEHEIAKRALSPLGTDLALIRDLSDVSQVAAVFGTFARRGTGACPFIAYVDVDEKASNVNVLHFEQSGLGLPDEAYYRADEHAGIRTKYKEHIAEMFSLSALTDLGDPLVLAENILDLETRLASFHYDVVTNRDSDATYHEVFAEELVALLPNFDWNTWLTQTNAPAGALVRVIVRQPAFLQGLSTLLTQERLEQWRQWLGWRVLSGAAAFLPSPFDEANFDFYQKTLRGVPEQRPRWRRGVDLVSASLGDPVGKIYVQRHFPPSAKTQIKTLVSNLLDAYRTEIGALSWMGPETKSAALAKLAKFTVKVGYPDKWRDYTNLEVTSEDLLDNLRRIAIFEFDWNFNKLGVPVDRSEWAMTPQTVNACIVFERNEIQFPAAILQPPFFDPTADDAANYGGIGGVIGHEIGHGFDDQGSKFDGDGNLISWWSDADRLAFERLADSLIAQYDLLEPSETPGSMVNGALTVGENIGDLGGIRMAYLAYQLSLKGAAAPTIDDLTGAQRFFSSWAQIWRAKVRPGEVLRRLAIDPHSPYEFRTNAIVSNLDEFYEAFDVKPGDRHFREPADRVKIW